jgi:sugar O-acyltransferase (sialic acid O-acetyltransferase NeuD family)
MDAKQMDERSVPVGIVVIGAGGFGRQMPWIIKDMYDAGTANYRFEGFADDSGDFETVEGYPIIGTIDHVLSRDSKPAVVCALGDPRLRKRIMDKCVAGGAKLASLVHPSVMCPEHVTFEDGCIVSAGTIMSTNVRVGFGALVNFGCRVGHDVDIRAFASIMPNVSIGGSTIIGEGSFIGISASIDSRITIGEWSLVGVGSVVVKDVPPRAIVAGVPGRVIGEVPVDAIRTPI